ncbi:Mobile element protein [Fimbriiglobus ruber]|uniref:Mobile element protein n=2 Tax=Fimbriiglobus ruber TaxID=1908690 RepID=A0A225DIZ2_9BACT|nr:Mobile element protein [Fimbriiglobus ruber]
MLVGAFGGHYLKRGSWGDRAAFIDHVRASGPEYNRPYARPFKWTWTNAKMRQWFAKHAHGICFTTSGRARKDNPIPPHTMAGTDISPPHRASTPRTRAAVAIPFVCGPRGRSSHQSSSSLGRRRGRSSSSGIGEAPQVSLGKNSV